ncbi:MAG TPA: hypothetical protein VED22_07845 [Nitrososphaerales archaeon]|nr:hypothetical protein [Nitrososphaerales archaeon]
MQRSAIIGALMIVGGAIILVLLSGFILSAFITLLKVLAVVLGIILVIGGVAMMLFGHRWWERRPERWGSPPSST